MKVMCGKGAPAGDGRTCGPGSLGQWLLASGLFGFLLCAGVAGGAESAGSLPNIVVILADDLGYGDLGCYNADSKIPTPHLDRLSEEGIRFTDAHAPSSVCTPTRYGLLTGRYCWRTSLKKGVLEGYDPLLIEPGRMTVASLLKRQGYATACIGKWHLGLGKEKPTDYAKLLKPGPRAAGFDYFFGIPASLDMPPYVFVENERVVEPASEQAVASEHRRRGGGGYWRAGAIAPGFKHGDVLPRLTEKAVAFVERQSAARPFFLYFPLNAPHTPWVPTAEFEGRSSAGYYGDFVMQTDASVGRVLAALEERGFKTNTLVIFTSDNGSHWPPGDITKWGHRANGELRGQKADIWEGGHRVPFLARWPGRIQPGTTSDQLVSLTDLLATAAAVTGASLPADAGEDSYNILPALLGEASPRPLRQAMVQHSFDGTFAIRLESWKLILGLGSRGFSQPRNVEPEPGGAAGQLYHLKTDIAESDNLYLDSPARVDHLGALLKEYQSEGRSHPVERE